MSFVWSNWVLRGHEVTGLALAVLHSAISPPLLPTCLSSSVALSSALVFLACYSGHFGLGLSLLLLLFRYLIPRPPLATRLWLSTRMSRDSQDGDHIDLHCTLGDCRVTISAPKSQATVSHLALGLPSHWSHQSRTWQQGGYCCGFPCLSSSSPGSGIKVVKLSGSSLHFRRREDQTSLGCWPLGKSRPPLPRRRAFQVQPFEDLAGRVTLDLPRIHGRLKPRCTLLEQEFWT